METKTILLNGKKLNEKQFKAVKVKELAEMLKINIEDAQSVKDAVIELKVTVKEALEVLNVEIKPIKKTRKRSSAPIHQVAEILIEMIGNKEHTIFDSKEVTNKTFKKIFNIELNEYINLKGFNKIKFFKEMQNKFECKAENVDKKIKNIIKGIVRSYAVSGDGTCISTNNTYIKKIQIRKNENGTYTAYTNKHQMFQKLMKEAENKIEKRKNK